MNCQQRIERKEPPTYGLAHLVRYVGELCEVCAYAWSASEEQWVYTLRLPSRQLLRVGERSLG
jgi:hypothetical protein